MMLAIGIVAGALIGYYFRPQVEKLINWAINAWNTRGL